MYEILVGNVFGYGYNPSDRFYTVGLNNYPDGMPVIGKPEIELLVQPDTMILRPQTLEQFVAGMFYCDAAAERDYAERHDELQTVWEDGRFVRTQGFDEIRELARQ